MLLIFARPINILLISFFLKYQMLRFGFAFAGIPERSVSAYLILTAIVTQFAAHEFEYLRFDEKIRNL